MIDKILHYAATIFISVFFIGTSFLGIYGIIYLGACLFKWLIK